MTFKVYGMALPRTHDDILCIAQSYDWNVAKVQGCPMQLCISGVEAESLADATSLVKGAIGDFGIIFLRMFAIRETCKAH